MNVLARTSVTSAAEAGKKIRFRFRYQIGSRVIIVFLKQYK